MWRRVLVADALAAAGLGAAAIAALIAVWSVPLYPAAMPSWYVLFLDLCRPAAVLVLQPERRCAAATWAGVLIGIAALAKVTALFALAGACWALVALRQSEDRERRGAPEIIAAALVFSVLVWRLANPLLSLAVVEHIVLPPVAIVCGLAIIEFRQGRANGFGIDPELWRRAAALLAGAAIPVAIYAAWLGSHAALVPFLDSLHNVVGRRTAAAALEPASSAAILYALPVVAILLGAGAFLRIRPWMLGVAGVACGVLAWLSDSVHVGFWNVLFGLLPLGALLFAIAAPGQRIRAAQSSPALLVFVPLAGDDGADAIPVRRSDLLSLRPAADPHCCGNGCRVAAVAAHPGALPASSPSSTSVRSA